MPSTNLLSSNLNTGPATNRPGHYFILSAAAFNWVASILIRWGNPDQNFPALHYLALLHVVYYYAMEYLYKNVAANKRRFSYHPVAQLTLVMLSICALRLSLELWESIALSGQGVNRLLSSQPSRLQFYLDITGAFIYVGIRTYLDALIDTISLLRQQQKWKIQLQRTQIAGLQSQLTPHFLFNNLNALSFLVECHTEKAAAFVEGFKGVFRYVLDTAPADTVLVEQELEFVESYLVLLKTRFDKNLVVAMDIPRVCAGKHIPPLTIQLLIENAMKHNVVSMRYPLFLKISGNERFIEVRNNLHPRADQSTHNGVGIKNITLRYEHLTNQKATFSVCDDEFVAQVPLLY